MAIICHRNSILIYINMPMVKLVSLHVVLLKVAVSKNSLTTFSEDLLQFNFWLVLKLIWEHYSGLSPTPPLSPQVTEHKPGTHINWPFWIHNFWHITKIVSYIENMVWPQTKRKRENRSRLRGFQNNRLTKEELKLFMIAIFQKLKDKTDNIDKELKLLHRIKVKC